jgi:hypothetical protein
MSWFPANRDLTPLEPYDWKLSRTVLRGERGSNAPDLPGGCFSITCKTVCVPCIYLHRRLLQRCIVGRYKLTLLDGATHGFTGDP